MAIDIKSFLADALLELCKTHALKSITVTELLAATGVSRQTFYNHFRDKGTLINWIYKTRVLSVWVDQDDENPERNFYLNCLDYFARMAELRFFLAQACASNSGNSLREYMILCARKWNVHWFQRQLGLDRLSDVMMFAANYHAAGTIDMCIDWLRDNNPVTPLEMAHRVNAVRVADMNAFLPQENGCARVVFFPPAAAESTPLQL